MAFYLLDARAKCTMDSNQFELNDAGTSSRYSLGRRRAQPTSRGYGRNGQRYNVQCEPAARYLLLLFIIDGDVLEFFSFRSGPSSR